MTAPEHVNLWHGYDLATLDRLARRAAAIAVGSRILDPGDRYETAWYGIVETIAEAETPPTVRAVVDAGLSAIDRAAEEHRQTWGMGRTIGNGLGGRPRFQQYWELGRVTPSPEDAVVDRLALRQIWPRLALRHQRALYALAIHGGDHHAAAASLGQTLNSFRTYLKEGRRAYRALWHEHETPTHMWSRAPADSTQTAMQTVAMRRRQRARRAADAA